MHQTCEQRQYQQQQYHEVRFTGHLTFFLKFRKQCGYMKITINFV